MNTATDPMLGEMFGDMSLWQTMLDRQRELFVGMDAGSRIGFVSREASGILPGKRLEGVQVVPSEVPLMAWEIENGGMSARIERFAGMASTRVAGRKASRARGSSMRASASDSPCTRQRPRQTPSP